MDRKTVLIVEDEARIRELIADCFSEHGFKVNQTSSGTEALALYHEQSTDLVILDIMIPEIDGWAVCRRIRKASDVPIIILTARSDDEDKLLGFELGADEYVTKPFSPSVLLARATNLLRRAEGSYVAGSELIQAHEITINTLSHEVKVNSGSIELTNREYQLLLYLIKNKGIVLSREQIMNGVWEPYPMADPRTVDTHIKKIRNKLGPAGARITTLIGAGYRFEG